MRIPLNDLLDVMSWPHGGWIDRQNGNVYRPYSFPDQLAMRVSCEDEDAHGQRIKMPEGDGYIKVLGINSAWMMYHFMMQNLEQYKDVFSRYDLERYIGDPPLENPDWKRVNGIPGEIEFHSEFMKMIEENSELYDLFEIFCDEQHLRIAQRWCSEVGIEIKYPSNMPRSGERMHTLILNGSPRPRGDTAFLIAELCKRLKGKVTQIDCYRAKISPCVDCRRCTKNPGCAIQDDMQRLYPILESCDNIVIASPVYFSLPTAPVLGVASRIQTYFCANFFRKEPVSITPKRGGIILCGGGSGSAEPAEATARRLLKYMKAKETGPITASLHTDKLPAAQDEAAMAQIHALAAFLNGEQV